MSSKKVYGNTLKRKKKERKKSASWKLESFVIECLPGENEMKYGYHGAFWKNTAF
jgi:hypothetical protein